MTLSPGRRVIAAALVFLASAFLAGVTPGPDGLAYHTFGITEGILAVLLTHTFLQRRVWWSPPGLLRWVAIGYGTIATGQLLELLLPPPGVLEWLVLTGLAFSAWAILAARSRSRLMVGLATAALLLSVLKFSVIPVLWVRAGPGPGEAWGLGDFAEGLRRLVVDYQPVTASGQLVGFAALACWAMGTRILWRQKRIRPKKTLR